MSRSLRAAAIGLVCVVLLVVGALNVDRLPLVTSPGTSYSAVFSDAGGLRSGDPVEVSGLRMGSVSGIAIEKSVVVVTFALRSDIRLGDRSRAAVKIGSLLGAKFLDIEPAGAGRLAADARIPLERTTPAYDIVQAFSTLTTTTEKIDKGALAQALDTIATTFKDSPQDTHDVLQGLAGFSNTIAERSNEVSDLLHHASQTAALLANRKGDLVALMQATTQLLTELEGRKAAIAQLLDTTTSLFAGLKQLIDENQATLGPALNQMHGVLATLAARQADLQSIAKNMDLFVRLFTNTLGSGPWFDSVIPNLPTKATVGGTP